ncbi:MAG TPA: kelch repeat-containing protein, partial [Bryobacteraceae bacterium]|nr:kelch repeat-containing protein [Bryobacteraceae bacterium]
MQSIVKRLMFFALAALVPATEEMQVLRSQLVRVLLLAGVGMQRVRQGCTLALLAAAFSFQAGAQPSWVQQFPAASPDYREASWMTWDGLHKQVVLFGGCTASSCPSADTWTWDGKTWTPMFSAVSPPARFRHCMMYDPGHEQVVLFGGEGENGFLNDTWVWDGSTWMQKSTAGAPIAQDCYASLAYDERHQQAIFFGKAAANSTASATWSWDGTNWSRLYPSTAPPYGSTPILVYDKGRQQLVLATYTDNPANNNYASTWTWDGANWNRITETGLLPSDQNPSEGVYDPVTKQILVFLEGPSVYGWNGAGWFPVSTAVEPPDRILPAMAFDEVNQQVVMFGGSGSGPSALANDTWTYGYPTLDWTQLAPNSMPSARGFVAMAFDGENNNTVLFGGLSSGPSYLSDTWTWDGSNWLQMSPSQSPPGRALPAMAYDGRNREVVLFGGFGPAGPVGGYYGDTWIWNGSNWSQKTPAHSPPAQAYHSMTFDTALQQVVLFSGMTCCNAAVSGDTWTWDGTDWTHQLPTTTPPETFAYSAAAFDGARGTTLRFDSFYQSPKWNASTWIYNGATWNNLSPTHTPGARILDSTLAYDSQRQQISLFGGSDSNTGANLSDTWLWSGFDWTQIAPPHNPSARGGFGYAFDPIHNNTVLFGGRYNGASEVYYNDTWILGPPSQGGATVAINVPAGVQFFFNGQSYTGSQTIPIAPGSYTLYAASPQTIATGTQATFASWSDGGAQSHLVTVAAGGLSITGTFNTSYLLTTVANPSAGGTVSGGGYYLSGTGATVTATPNANYLFGSWSGACSGSGACSVTMNAPATVTANFTLNVVQYTVTVPASVQFTFNGTTYTGPQTLTVAPGSYTLSTTTPQATAAGTQAVFQSWSDGGAISHPVTLSLGPAQTVTGVFTTQYLLTTAALPAGAGSISPASQYFNASTVVPVTALANGGNEFEFWSGACTGSATCSVTMNAPVTVTANFAAPSTWVQLGPATSPSARTLAATASDPVRQQVVVFGGAIDGQDQVYTNETWVWNGTTWTQMHP